MQNQWKNFRAGDGYTDRSHEKTLPLLESLLFNNNIPGTPVYY